MPKTFTHLYPRVCAFENLYFAYRAARKNGKRSKPHVAAFEYHLEKELDQLQKELTERTYQPGGYRHFYIYERKRRKINAAPFRDRSSPLPSHQVIPSQRWLVFIGNHGSELSPFRDAVYPHR